MKLKNAKLESLDQNQKRYHFNEILNDKILDENGTPYISFDVVIYKNKTKSFLKELREAFSYRILCDGTMSCPTCSGEHEIKLTIHKATLKVNSTIELKEDQNILRLMFMIHLPDDEDEFYNIVVQ